MYVKTPSCHSSIWRLQSGSEWRHELERWTRYEHNNHPCDEVAVGMLCVQVGQKKAKYSTKAQRHRSTGHRPAVHDRGAEASADDHDDVIMIMADVPDRQQGAADGHQGPCGSDASSSSSAGSQGVESDMPSERTSSTDVSNSLTSTFVSPSNSSSRSASARPPARPVRRSLQRIISGSSCWLDSRHSWQDVDLWYRDWSDEFHVLHTTNFYLFC